MRGSKISRELYLFSLLTAITVFTWVSLDLYRVFQKKEAPKVTPQQLEPLNPEIDTKIFDELSQRRQFTGEELIIQVSPTPVATASGQR